MAILTRAELDLRLGAADVARLADRDAVTGEDTGAVDAALNDAEYEVLGYVRMVTPAPVPDPAPDILKRIVAFVARYNLFRRDVPDTHPAYIAYRDAVKELQAIASGRIALPFGSDQANAASASAGTAYAPARLLTDSALDAMMPEARA